MYTNSGVVSSAVPIKFLKRIYKESTEFLRRFFTFLAVSSLFIGATGFFKTYIGYIMMDLRPSLALSFAVFLVSFCVYSLDKVADMNNDLTNMPERCGFLAGRRNTVIAYSLAAYAGALAIVWMIEPMALPVVFVPFIANAFYGTKLIPGLPRLKDIPVMKNVIVAIAWSLTTILIAGYQILFTAPEVVAMVIYFMLIKTFIDTVLYDVRDVKGDREAGVRTMPALLGERKTIIVLLLLNSTLLPWTMLAHESVRPLAAILTIYGYAYIVYFRTRRNPLVLDFVVEGEWMLATAMLLML
ncbi:MAG: UbiA family prenyltransferase [Methanosarcinales archaeon]|nr:UbiA family prenyltransferase [Methanosarcinales archaeon]